MSYKILWLSRLIPQGAQIKELAEKFGEIEIVQKSISLDNNPFRAVDEVADLMRQNGADDIVGVLPVSHLAALTQLHIKPIRAIMERRPTGRTLDNGEIEYNFEHVSFERVIRVEVQTEAL